jgi:hypothetical protein
MEPSFITLGDYAYRPRIYVTCQINNVFIEIDLIAERITRMTAFPFRDFSRQSYGFDASAADNKINIANWPVKGIPSPYGAAFFYLHDKHYVVFANQGLARVNSRYDEQRVVSTVQLDPNQFRDRNNASYLQQPAQLGQLVVSINGADVNNDGKLDRLYAFGSRSISVWQVNSTNGNQQIYESGDDIEVTLQASTPAVFNAAYTNPASSFDVRSPFSGAEPSTVAVGKIDYHKILFVGLEQQSTILAYSLSKPEQPRIVAYTGDMDFDATVPVDKQPRDLLFLSSASVCRLIQPTHSALFSVVSAANSSSIYHRAGVVAYRILVAWIS